MDKLDMFYLFLAFATLFVVGMLFGGKVEQGPSFNRGVCHQHCVHTGWDTGEWDDSEDDPICTCVKRAVRP